MTEEYRWTDEAVERAKALIERMAVSTIMHRDYADAREILDSIKVDPVGDLVCKYSYILRESQNRAYRADLRQAILAGIELDKKGAEQ